MMQKWEYTWLNIDDAKIKGKKAGSKEFTDGKTAMEYIDYYGSLGWELVNVTPSNEYCGSHMYWFKRPVE